MNKKMSLDSVIQIRIGPREEATIRYCMDKCNGGTRSGAIRKILMEWLVSKLADDEDESGLNKF